MLPSPALAALILLNGLGREEEDKKEKDERDEEVLEAGERAQHFR